MNERRAGRKRRTLMLVVMSVALSGCLAPLPVEPYDSGGYDYEAEAPPPIDVEEGGFVVEDVDLEPLSDEALDMAEEYVAEEAAAEASDGAIDAAELLRSLNDEELIVIALLLDRRAAEGLPALDLDARLVTAAREHSADMADMGRCSHDGSDGREPAERIADAGYAGRASGENVLCGSVTPEKAVEMWMGSPAHRRNILSESFEDIGVGVDTQSPGGPTWTLTFGAGD